MAITISDSTLAGAAWGALIGGAVGVLVVTGIAVMSGAMSFGGWGTADQFGPALRKGLLRIVPVTAAIGAAIGAVTG